MIAKRDPQYLNKECPKDIKMTKSEFLEISQCCTQRLVTMRRPALASSSPMQEVEQILVPQQRFREQQIALASDAAALMRQQVEQ